MNRARGVLPASFPISRFDVRLDRESVWLLLNVRWATSRSATFLETRTEPTPGLEPGTGGLQNHCSTVELGRRCFPVHFRTLRCTRGREFGVRAREFAVGSF